MSRDRNLCRALTTVSSKYGEKGTKVFQGYLSDFVRPYLCKDNPILAAALSLIRSNDLERFLLGPTVSDGIAKSLNDGTLPNIVGGFRGGRGRGYGGRDSGGRGALHRGRGRGAIHNQVGNRGGRGGQSTPSGRGGRGGGYTHDTRFAPNAYKDWGQPAAPAVFPAKQKCAYCNFEVTLHDAKFNWFHHHYRHCSKEAFWAEA